MWCSKQSLDHENHPVDLSDDCACSSSSWPLSQFTLSEHHARCRLQEGASCTSACNAEADQWNKITLIIKLYLLSTHLLSAVLSLLHRRRENRGTAGVRWPAWCCWPGHWGKQPGAKDSGRPPEEAESLLLPPNRPQASRHLVLALRGPFRAPEQQNWKKMNLYWSKLPSLC